MNERFRGEILNTETVGKVLPRVYLIHKAE